MSEQQLTLRRDSPSVLRLFLLGGFRIERAGHVIPDSAWKRRSAKTLVKILAIVPGHQLHREQATEMLWPDAPPKSAADSLHKALRAARQALEPELAPGEPSCCLHMTGDLLVLNIEHVWIDADHFERSARMALAQREESLLEEAIALYAGELLPEDRYEDWAAAKREELAELANQVALRLADLLEQRGAYIEAAHQLGQVLQQDTLREDVHRHLMRVYALSGRREQAIRQYQVCREALRRELDAEPEPQTEKLYREILAGQISRDQGHSMEVQEVRRPAVPLPSSVRQHPLSPFVGRAEALAYLVNELERARVGQGTMILVGGEAGVGKTRLAAELAQRAQSQRAIVLWGASYEQEGLISYGPLVEALESYLLSLADADREKVGQAYPELAQLVPTLGHGRGPPNPFADPERERRQIFAAVVRFLDELSEKQPLLVILDDLHAADRATLELVHHLARLSPRHRWLILGTYREEDVEPGAVFQKLCMTITREGWCRRVDLRRLGREDSEELVRAVLRHGIPAPGLVDQLYALSLGNPFFILQLVESLKEQGKLTLVNGSWQAVIDDIPAIPGQVRELVEARVDTLEPDVRRVLALAAVAGMDFLFHDLSTAAIQYLALSEGEFLDALDRAVDLGIVEERGDSYAFRHPLFRATLYERLTRARRSRLHGALAEVIEQHRPGDVETLAHHYSRSQDEEKAVAYLERAGNRAQAVSAHETAETYYRELVTRLEKLGRITDAAAARGRLAAVLTVEMRFDEALEALEQAAETYKTTGDTEGMVRVAILLGRARFLQGAPDAGVVHIRAVLDALGKDGTEARPFPALSALHVVLANLYFVKGEYEKSVTSAEQALQIAGEAHNVPVQARAEAIRGVSLANMGRCLEALQALEHALTLAEAIDDYDSLTNALTGLGATYRFMGEFERSKAYLERQAELAERHHDPVWIASALSHLAGEAFFLGDWRRANEYLERAGHATEQTPFWLLAYLLIEEGQIRLAEGKWPQAVKVLEEAIVIAESAGDIMALRFAHRLLAERDILVGRPDEAVARLEPLLDRSTSEEHIVTYMLPILGWAYLETGDEGRAEEAVANAIRRATNERNRLTLVDALGVRGMLSARQGQWEESARAFDEAAQLASNMNFPYAEARVLYDWACVHCRRKGTAWAQQHLECALAVFQRLGAGPYIERAERALTELRLGKNQSHMP